MDEFIKKTVDVTFADLLRLIDAKTILNAWDCVYVDGECYQRDINEEDWRKYDDWYVRNVFPYFESGS